MDEVKEERGDEKRHAERLKVPWMQSGRSRERGVEQDGGVEKG